MNDDIIPSARRTPRYLAEDEGADEGRLIGERGLWANVVRRALADAKGQRLASDPSLSHNHHQRDARRWFRLRSRDYVGGWGWVIDELGLPSCWVRRIEREAQRDNIIDLAALFEAEEQNLRG